ncbi:Leucine-rich repeat-containing protein 15 [Holothuria leucospilota]|uniref:Leucine-rich repeat-containing protein 15 n=1 Tax=Holothuria leucospilota TaxID=206669 RepID=A0A9Q1CTL9_HOLLE|nr:Leucine-rich repeat-containing protein 15 [Holothuria leucospilota]
MLRNTVFFIFLVSGIITINNACKSHFRVYNDCENHFLSGCCTLGKIFVCSVVNLTNSNDFAKEIPKTISVLTVANIKTSFINNGDWKFLSNLTNLMELSFINNRMSILYDLKSVYLNDLDKLKLLSFALGDLRIFPVEKFKNLSSLRYLDLHCNQLQSVGDGHWNFSVLNELILSNNRLTAVRAGQLKGLENLSKLDLSYNRISYFSMKVLDAMPMLTYLSLSFNRLGHISDSSQQHSNLYFLGLSCNLFVGLEPLVFNGLKSFHSVDYYNNTIKYPPSGNSKNTVSLALALSLSSNVIEVLSPHYFDNFPHLNRIKVENNNIRHIEETTFRSVHNVTSIDMSLNQIHSIPRKLFQHLQKLVIVELQFNRIQTFHPFLFNHLAPHLQLFADDNPIVCDCQALPLLMWLSDSEMSLENFPRCQSPKEVQSQSIYYVKLLSDCPHSTRMPSSTYVTPPSYTSPPRDHGTLSLTLAACAFVMILICSLSLCLCIVG